MCYNENMKYENKLILFRKISDVEFKDITERIKYYEKEYNNTYCIIFNDNTKIHAKAENVIELDNFGSLDINNRIITYKNTVKTDVVKIEIFKDIYKHKFYKIYCKNGFHFVCEDCELSFYRYSDSDKSLIEYWKNCACESKIDTVQHLMLKQYDKLDLDPRSVLYHYINKINSENKVKDNIICPFNFNNSQLKAIYSALKNKISIIKGPPGTGKTQTILNILCNLVVRGKSIAIISANNTAIDNIEKKLKSNGYGSLYASLGNGERKAEFFRSNIQDLKTEKIDKVDIPLNKLKFLSKLFESENKTKIIKEEIESLKLEQQYYEKFHHESIINIDKYKFKTSKSLINYITSYQEDTKEKNFTFFLWLKLIFKYGFKKSLIKAKNRYQIITSLEYKYYSLKIEELLNELEVFENLIKSNNLKDLSLEYNSLSKKYLDYFINTNIDFQTNFTQKNYKQKFAQFIKRYPIITSTAISFMTSIESEYMFDYVIIDESSQVTIPSTIPLLNKCKNLVIVGDDKQLSPIEKYITKCVFDDAFNSNKHSLITSFMMIYPTTITTLLEHYRCNPKIIGFCNLKYYDNQLIPFTTDDKGMKSLSVYLTSNENHMRKIYDGELNGIYNQREIDTIDDILNDPELTNIDHNDIGIISPYRLQVDKLQKKYKNIECDTIHKFQGREKNTIIFSTVLDCKASKNDFAFVDNANMINVSVSRAINKFILVTNENVFEEKGKEIHDLISYISYKSMNENLYKSKCISIFDYLYKSKEQERKTLLSNTSSKSNYASEKLLRALLDKLLQQSPYKQFYIQEQVKIKDIISDFNIFNDQEFSYIKNNCSVDFLIKDKVCQDIICIIEVDGVAFHENNKEQQVKDKLKDSILEKCNINLLRLKTNGSNEESKIKKIFDSYLNKFKY